MLCTLSTHHYIWNNIFCPCRASDSKEPVPERTEQKYEPSFRKVPDKVPCSFNLSNSCIQLVTQVNVSQAVLQQQRLATTGSKLSLLSKSTTINKTENEPDAKLTTADAIRRLRERGKQGPDLFPAKRLLHPGVAEENTCDAPNHSFSDRTNGYKIMRAQSVEEADKRWEEIFSRYVFYDACVSILQQYHAKRWLW